MRLLSLALLVVGGFLLGNTSTDILTAGLAGLLLYIGGIIIGSLISNKV